MSLNQNAVKVVIEGTRIGGEIWSTGFWMGHDNGDTPSQANLDALVAAISSAWSTQWTQLAPQASASTKPTDVRAYLYPSGSDTASLISELHSELAAGSSSNRHPYQVGCVVSLRSAVPTRSGRGRMYLPLDGLAMDTTGGQYTSAVTTDVGLRMKNFIDAVNALSITGFTFQEVVVASQTEGVVRLVERIIVNSLPDIQRRRSNRLIAATENVRAIVP